MRCILLFSVLFIYGCNLPDDAPVLVINEKEMLLTSKSKISSLQVLFSLKNQNENNNYYLSCSCLKSSYEMEINLLNPSSSSKKDIYNCTLVSGSDKIELNNMSANDTIDLIIKANGDIYTANFEYSHSFSKNDTSIIELKPISW